MTQLPLLLGQPHRNQQLFSDYYLNHLLPQRSDWQLLAADARTGQAQIAEIFARYTPSTNEAQTEDGLIKPILSVLGHTFEIQAPLATPDGTKKPDYVLYRDSATLVANKGKVLTETLLRGHTIAVGDAKYWDRPLDTALKGSADPFTNKNPSYQIAFYLQHSGLDWGILTNGRLWRLYHKDTAHKLDRYYEVDLPALLQRGDPAAFLYFYAFFHRSAFEPQPLGLAELLRESADYARGVSATLKTQVFGALRHLAQGFLDYPRNQLQPDPATLSAIYDHSLIVLYRLLFILYAEARDLLPLRESPQYRDSYSVYAMTRTIASDLALGRQLLPTTARLWPQLRELFAIINTGSPPLKVATFNGGLFDPQRYPFLEQYSVGDQHLQQAIDKLARVEGQFIDYRDLAERHLGTIYEGLLEYHLEAIQPEYGWTVDLFNDRGERRVTGSYYTPDFIVRYMVDQTLRPVLNAAVADQPNDVAKIDAVLAINCIDPSMGSGHFLVEATEYIARFLVDLAVTPGAEAHGEADLAYWKRRVVQSCIYGVDLNPLAVDLAKLSLWLATVAKDRPLSFLDHHLRCGNALVGTRIAELSNTDSPAKKPSRKAKQAAEAGQISMLDDADFRQSMSTAVDSMWLIERTAGNTLAEVHEQERLYAMLRDSLTRKYARLADLSTARHFGITIDPQLWQPLVHFVTGRALTALPKFEDWLTTSNEIAARQHFFHWDLEFPEIFFDRHGQPLGERAGFDAVIGNPPYVRQEVLGPLKPYLERAYPETYHGFADLYVYFYHQGLRLLRLGGRMSYIVTNKWLRAGYGEPLRAYFATQKTLEQIIDFGHAPIFPDADVFPCIIVLQKPLPDTDQTTTRQVQITAFPREALKVVQLDDYVHRHSHHVPLSRFGGAAWSLEVSEIDDLMTKIRHAGMPLTEFAGVKPYYGIKTGLNEVFLIDTPTKERLVREDLQSAEIIKPYLRGQDMSRWSPEWAGLWMIFTRRGIDIEAYPAIKQYLLQFREQLEPKPKDWPGQDWPGRKSGSYKWYEVQDPVEYWRIFEQPKFTIQRIAFHSRVGFDAEGLYINDSAIILPTSDFWLLACLNSPALWYYSFRHFPHKKDEALAMDIPYVETLPIAPCNNDTRAEVELAVARLIAITRGDQAARRDLLDWLRTEFDVESPGQKLAEFATLDVDTFIEEVRKRRPKTASRLTPAALRDLRNAFTEQATPVQQRRQEAAVLECRLADLVNQAYGLTPEDIDLLWRTAPPRMPLGRPAQLPTHND